MHFRAFAHLRAELAWIQSFVALDKAAPNPYYGFKKGGGLCSTHTGIPCMDWTKQARQPETGLRIPAAILKSATIPPPEQSLPATTPIPTVGHGILTRQSLPYAEHTVTCPHRTLRTVSRSAWTSVKQVRLSLCKQQENLFRYAAWLQFQKRSPGSDVSMPAESALMSSPSPIPITKPPAW